MKKLNFLFLLFVGLIGLSTLTSCNPTENDDVKPTLGFIAEAASITADKTVAVKAPLLFKVSGAVNPNTKKNLQSLKIQSFKNNSPVIDTLVSINSDSFLGSFTFNADSSYSVEEKFTFTLLDKGGQTTIKSFVITTEVAPVTSTPFGTAVSGAFYHAQGSNGCTGGYDLVSGAAVAGAGVDADRDILNTDIAAAAFTGSWESKNSTMYVKDNSFNFASGSVQEAATAYAAGVASEIVTNPAINDVYIAKLRGGADYALITITSLDANDVTCNASTFNKGKLGFDYKVQ